MACKDCIKWLESLKKELGQSQFQGLWCYEQALAETIELLQSDRIVELPCKVGDTVYYFFSDSNYKKYGVYEIVGFHIDKYRTAFQIELCGYKCLVDTEFLGEKIFLTREEAEKKLKELNDNEMSI